MIHELRNAGFKTLGPAVNVIQALDIIQRDHCDVAVLDINLVSETSETVARPAVRCEDSISRSVRVFKAAGARDI